MGLRVTGVGRAAELPEAIERAVADAQKTAAVEGLKHSETWHFHVLELLEAGRPSRFLVRASADWVSVLS
jgi:ribosomal protein S5